MYAQLNVRNPQGLPTRLVMGCVEPAQNAAAILLECGYEVESLEVVDLPPARDSLERKRAEYLMTLIFEPAEGEA